MVYFVTPGTGASEGRFLVCSSANNGDAVAGMPFDTEQEANDMRDDLNVEFESVPETESVADLPDDIKRVLEALN